MNDIDKGPSADEETISFIGNPANEIVSRRKPEETSGKEKLASKTIGLGKPDNSSEASQTEKTKVFQKRDKSFDSLKKPELKETPKSMPGDITNNLPKTPSNASNLILIISAVGLACAGALIVWLLLT